MSEASSEHLDLDTLADLEEGLTEPTAAAAARAHVEACDDCRDLVSRLRTTRALLSALPPEPMPPQVAARVDAALTAAEGAPANTIVPLARRKRAWNSPAVAGTAAAAAVVILVAAIVAGTLIHHGGKNTHADSAANSGSSAFGGKSAPTTTKEWSTDTNYTAATIATEVPNLVLGTPPPASTLSHSGAASASGGTATQPSPSTSGQAAPPGVLSYTQAQLRASPAAVLACGQILAGGVPTIPVAVDFARYDGKPAVVFVLPAVGHPTTKLDVWVVRSTCSASSFDLPLFRVDRP